MANRTTLSLMLTLWVAALTTIRPLAQAEASSKERRFSVCDWLSDQSGLPRTIILQHNAEYPLLSTAIGALPLDRVQQAEAASAGERRALLAGRLSTGRAKTSTIAIIGQAAFPATQPHRPFNRQSADRAPQPSAKPSAAQGAARSALRSRARGHELDYGR